MKEIIITKNEAGQRIDRFIRKYLGNASLGFIYKQIRKKNIVVNSNKVDEKYILQEKDIIKIFFSDETIKKLKTEKKKVKSNIKLDILYEDSNIILVNKPVGILSHSANRDYSEENMVDAIISYLIEKGEFIPRLSKTFTPSIANRLDRNTSGILIGAKTFDAIQELNRAQRNSTIKKYYYTLVSGKIEGGGIEKARIEKVKNHENLVKVSKSNNEDGKNITTAYKSITTSDKYTLLEIDLITGRTHQIRAHLNFLGMPVVGDRKYGRKNINAYFKNKYALDNQLLHCYKVYFDGLENNLKHLNGKEFTAPNPKVLDKILKGEFNG